MSPLTTGMIGAFRSDLSNFFSSRQIDVPLSLQGLLGRLLRGLLAALSRPLAAVALELSLHARETDGRHGIDLARQAHVDRVKWLRHRAQWEIVAAHEASASALAACWAVSADAARSAAS